MARAHVPCEVKDCRRAALWIVWGCGVDPIVLCELDRRVLYAASEGTRHTWIAAPLVYGVN